MATDVERVTVVLLAVLRVVEAGLDRLSVASDRVLLREFLNDHPEVTIRYPDGERQ